jgi:UDP-N-acetylglucosamine 2-epimerase
LAEGVPPESIWVTGNTVIDALKLTAARVNREKDYWGEYLARQYGLALDGRRLLLVTGHRRENFGTGFKNICLALRDLVEHYPDIHVVYPVHLNPRVQRPVKEILAAGPWPDPATLKAGGRGGLSLIPPLDYAPFVFLMSQSYLVLTDSGGIQEEAPALGKPVLVMRDLTERPEGVWAQTAKLVGTDRQRFFQESGELLDNPISYGKMAQACHLYGDGQASQRIVAILKRGTK